MIVAIGRVDLHSHSTNASLPTNSCTSVHLVVAGWTIIKLFLPTHTPQDVYWLLCFDFYEGHKRSIIFLVPCGVAFQCCDPINDALHSDKLVWDFNSYLFGDDVFHLLLLTVFRRLVCNQLLHELIKGHLVASTVLVYKILRAWLLIWAYISIYSIESILIWLFVMPDSLKLINSSFRWRNARQISV